VAVAVGFTLQPEVEFLDLCDRLIRAEVDYYEVAPETTWRVRRDGTLEENGFHRRFREIAADTGRFFVAHGVGFSVGASARRDAGRRRRWLARLAADQARFRYRWYTDHLGASAPDGLAATLPLPLPLTATVARVVRKRLTEMSRVIGSGDVGVENNVAYFVLGDALDEASLYAACAHGARRHLLLDLHNLYTMSVNHGVDPEAWLARVPLDRVIEIHVSGGADADPAWVPSGRTLRLDSHDAAVPEEVWRLLERVLPRCPNLRGVTVERMEGTVTAADVPQLVDEVRRARALVRAARPVSAPPRRDVALAREELGAWESIVTRLVLARDPASELARLRRSRTIPVTLRRRLARADVDGVVLTSLLVVRLRFERLLRGSPAAEAWFDEDAEGFTAAFKRYHAAVPPTAFFPPDEADLFEAWRRADIRESA
jgi:hypothetical protein